LISYAKKSIVISGKSNIMNKNLLRNTYIPIIVLSFMGIGIFFLAISHAVTPYGIEEAEAGTLAGNASIVADSSASDGEAVQFGDKSTSTSTAPSGLAMPSSTTYPGYRQVLADDFTGTSLNQTTWNGFYQDLDQQFGPFLSSHGTVSSGMVTMSDYVDSAADSASSGTDRAGTGMETRTSWASGIALVRARADGGTGVTMCIGLIGTSTWPPELDFYEDGLQSDNLRQRFTATSHYGSSNNQVSSTNTSVDATQWHTYGVEWNSSKISYLVDGTVWYSITNPDPSGSNSFGVAQSLFMQIETLDWGSNNVPVNSSTPAKVNMDVDWATVYTPN
jgi:beta-glucanase (GH16 family)